MSAAGLVCRALDLADFPSKAIQKVVATFLASMVVAMPITFEHGLELYAQHQARVIEGQILAPMFHALNLAPTTGIVSPSAEMTDRPSTSRARHPLTPSAAAHP